MESAQVLPISSASRHRFPLGENVYAYVTTRKGCAKIHIRHFASPTNTKGGAVVPTTKGVKIDLKMFNRLCKAKKLITEAYNKQLVTKTQKRQRVSKDKKEKISTFVAQYRTGFADTSTATATATTSTHADVDPHCSCFNLSALTPKYPVYPAPTNSILYPAHCDNNNKDDTTTTILPSAIYPDCVWIFFYSIEGKNVFFWESVRVTICFTTAARPSRAVNDVSPALESERVTIFFTTTERPARGARSEWCKPRPPLVGHNTLLVAVVV